MLISVHLPKTAGSSFRTSLSEHYEDSFLIDNSAVPLGKFGRPAWNNPDTQKKRAALKACIKNAIKPPQDIECIHGHFFPVKYLSCRNAKFVTWVRDPVERLISHYFYWFEIYKPRLLDKPMSLHRQVVEEKWSLERFCLCPELRNTYSQALWGFPVSRFDFIGVTEYYESELKWFAKEFIGTELTAYQHNQNTNKDYSSYTEDNGLREQIEKYHSKDVSLYKRALDTRLKTRS